MTILKCSCGQMLTTKNVFQVKRSSDMGPDALFVTHNDPKCYSTMILLKLVDRVNLVFQRANRKVA